MPRVTVVVRNTEGVVAKLKARDAATRERIRAIVEESALRVLNSAQALCPFDTGFMAEHMRLDLTQGGFNYVIGWYAEDFLGTTRRGGLPTPFYPPYVVFGSPSAAGRDPLTPAMEEEKPRARAAMAKALRG